jgi:O-antigen ligase
LRRDLPAFAVTVGAAGLLYLSPTLITTGVALVALWVLIFNRPVIGLALIVFWSPFHLVPIDLAFFALPMVEINVLLTLSAVIARSLILRPKRALSASPMRGLRWMDWAMLAFVGAACLTLLWAEQSGPATREFRIIVIEPALLYLLIRVIRPTRADLVRLVDVLILSGVAVSAIGLVQYVMGGPGITIAEAGSRRLMSVFSSPNNLALFLGRCVPFAVAMALVAPAGRGGWLTLRRACAACAALVMLAALALTQSAGAALLGLPAGLAAVFLLWDGRWGLVLVGVMALGLLSLIPLSRFVPRLQGALDLTRTSSFTRTQLWTSTINLLRERPLTGAGLDQFLYLYRSRYILPEAWQEPNLSHPHNLLLDYWTRLGCLSWQRCNSGSGVLACGPGDGCDGRATWIGWCWQRWSARWAAWRTFWDMAWSITATSW